MLEAFMKVAYERGRAREERDKLAAAMAEHLPLHELKKLATGETKLAWHCDDGKETMDFLSQFEGTPLMAQALQLEEAGIQLEEQENQQRQMRHQQSKLDDMDGIWDKKSALSTQKKLLLIQLAKMKLESGAAGPPAPEGMMGAPPSATPPEPSANPGATAGMAAQESPMAGDAVKAAAAGWVREMAQQEADIQRMRKMAAGLAGLGQAALGVAKANKGALIGAGIGAASGAAAGGLGEHGSVGRALGGAVGGAAGGALLGGGAQIGMRANHLMNTKNMGAMEAIQGAAGRQLANTTGAVRKAMPAVATPAAAAAQAAGGAASATSPLASSAPAAVAPSTAVAVNGRTGIAQQPDPFGARARMAAAQHENELAAQYGGRTHNEEAMLGKYGAAHEAVLKALKDNAAPLAGAAIGGGAGVASALGEKDDDRRHKKMLVRGVMGASLGTAAGLGFRNAGRKAEAGAASAAQDVAPAVAPPSVSERIMASAPDARPLPDLRAQGEAERHFLEDYRAWHRSGEIGEPPMPPRHLPGHHVHRVHQQADQAAAEILQNYNNQIRTNYGA